MFEEYMNACGLIAKVIPGLAMCVNIPLRLGSLITKIIKTINVVVEGLYMPVDQLVFLMSDFDVILGMN